MMPTVVLSAAELIVASQIAAMRHVSNLKRGVRAKYGAPEDEGAWEINIIGCLGEMAVAKYFNLYWAGSINDFEAVDVGGKIQARTRRKTHHKLILHPSDSDALPFVLVHVRPPSFDLIGWVCGREGKQQCYWDDPLGGRPAFFVPESALHPVQELIFDPAPAFQRAAE